MNGAICKEPGAPSVFPDDWEAGRHGRAKKAQALAMCRICPVRLECGLTALAEYDSGLVLYGIRCGVTFKDVESGRQDKPVARLRALVERLSAERLA